MRWWWVILGCWACDRGLPAPSEADLGGADDMAIVDAATPQDMRPGDMTPPVDMAPPPVDMAPPPVDMTPPADMAPPVDMAPPPVDMAPPLVDMAPPPLDMAPLPVDMAPPPVDMAPPPVDMAPPPVDMAPPPVDMAPPPVDMAPPPVDMAPPPVDMAPPPVDMAPPPLDMAPPPVDMAPPPVDMAPPPIDMFDPCAALDCAPAPAAICVDRETLRTFAADGRCVVDDDGAHCEHDAEDAPCAPGDLCFDGACGPPPGPRIGELVITEVMPDPHGILADRQAQWVELQNVSDRPLPLDGCVVEVDRGQAVLAGELAADGILLLGNSAERGLNGDLAIDAVFDAILSVRGGTIRVLCDEVEVDRVQFGRRPQWPVLRAYSLSLDPERRDPVANDSPDAWCLGPAIYLRDDADPTRDNHGSPGEANPSCTRLADFGRLQIPEVIVDGPGAEVQVIGRVRHAGITDRTPGNDPSPLLIAQVGYGPDGSVPDDSWTWQLAGPHFDFDGAEPDTDEYQRLIALPDRGRYDFAWRFSADEGRSWRYADAGAGSADGYAPEDAGDLRVEGTARVRGAGEIVISEIFFRTPPLDGDAQWVELHNTLAEPLDLTGCTLESPSFVRAPLDGIVIDPNAWLAVPRVADPALNGGIETPVGFGFELPLEGGTMALVCRFEIDRVYWDDAVLYPPGADASLQLTVDRLDAVVNDDAAWWCPGEAIFDAATGRRGTPGAPNRDCGPLRGYPGPQMQRLFEVHCGDCHLRGESLGDLSLEVFELNTFDIPAVQEPDMALITPGDRQQSYLWHKVAGTHFVLDIGDGVQMPPGQPFQPGVIERMGLYVDELPPQ